MSKAALIATIMAVVLTGCWCKRCQGQEVQSATVTVTATDVVEWKVSIYNGLNRLTGNPYSAVMDIFLKGVFGFTTVPTGNQSVTITKTSYDGMQSIRNSINIKLGTAIIEQATVLEDNREAIDAAIAAATDTITDKRTRDAFMLKARLLRRD